MNHSSSFNSFSSSSFPEVIFVEIVVLFLLDSFAQGAVFVQQNAVWKVVILLCDTKPLVDLFFIPDFESCLNEPPLVAVCVGLMLRSSFGL
jgi:hypothetical protein